MHALLLTSLLFTNAGEIPIVLTVRYRWTPDALRSPEDLPSHHLIVGLGFRAAD